MTTIQLTTAQARLLFGMGVVTQLHNRAAELRLEGDNYWDKDKTYGASCHEAAREMEVLANLLTGKK